MPVFEGLKSLKRLKELEEEMLRLTRIVEARDLDWQDMRARCKRLLDRTEKAAARASVPEEATGDPSDAANVFDHLTPSQRRLQEQVNNRRRLLGLNKEPS